MIRGALTFAVPLALAGCTSGTEGAPRQSAAVVQPIRTLAPPIVPAPVQEAVQGPTTFEFDGRLTQGGWIRGRAPAGTAAASLDGTALVLDAKGRFFAAFDRDAPAAATLLARLSDGREVRSPLAIVPRAWQIEQINAARTPGGASETFMALRRPELARIAAAREADHPIEGWRQAFVWPTAGRISGRFGSQRVYRGEPGAYHSGLDIAPGGSGAAYVAPADGVIVLAAELPFTLEGNLLIIDHGMGLNSAFLHSSRLAVKEGDTVRQGQTIGYVGMTGRATGPHLHWSIKWRDARLDPLLFVPPR